MADDTPSRILVPTDFSDQSNHALRYAASLGERFGAELHLLHVVTLHALEGGGQTFPDLDPLLDAADRAARRQMDAGALDRGAAEASVVTRVERAVNAWDAILEVARDDDVDLVVMAMHSGSRLGRFLLGSVTERVLRFAPCPVLVVERGDRDFVDADTMQVRLQRVVVADDLSEGSLGCFRFAARWLEPYGPEMHLLHAVDFDVPAPYTMGGVSSVFQLDSGLRERVADALDRRAAEVLPPSWKVVTAVREGRPHRVVPDYASQIGADLLLLAGETRIDLSERVMGGTVERMARHAPCPMLVV